MKRKVIIYAYWALAVLLTATMLHSLSYSFLESMLLGSLLLPGGMIIKFEFPKILQQPTKQMITNITFLALTVIVIEILLIFSGHAILVTQKHEFNMYNEFDPANNIPNLLLNPVFLIILLIFFSGGDYLLTVLMRKHLKDAPADITFTSDRKPVTLLQSEILYVESNDTEVWIHATDGQKYRNKTPISQWENLLGMDFLRIHRSFLVNRVHIIKSDADTLTLEGGQALPVSRKYRDSINPCR